MNETPPTPLHPIRPGDTRLRLHHIILCTGDPMTYPAPKIIGLCGPKVGKSTYAKSFESRRLSFATLIKECSRLSYRISLVRKRRKDTGLPDGITVSGFHPPISGAGNDLSEHMVDAAMRQAEDHLCKR